MSTLQKAVLIFWLIMGSVLAGMVIEESAVDGGHWSSADVEKALQQSRWRESRPK